MACSFSVRDCDYMITFWDKMHCYITFIVIVTFTTYINNCLLVVSDFYEMMLFLEFIVEVFHEHVLL